ncbi:hypothetical protein NUW54_g8488 [Trametes sanguinea]|uniref:Uncharacterized protein n=1 Tax=Trametes sanguinea TaxID=158606 RepID=A0ACC1PFP1_9APHY|nr:hypothetical protein NUW54_g8488 [Trametes sanguinea]
MRDDATGTHLYGGTDDAGHGDCASTSSSSQRRADWTNSLNPPPKRPSQIGLPFRMHPRPTSGVHEYPPQDLRQLAPSLDDYRCQLRCIGASLGQLIFCAIVLKSRCGHIDIPISSLPSADPTQETSSYPMEIALPA